MNSGMLGLLSAVSILCGCTVVSQPVKYDQRQEGELNIRTDVEDVVFVVVPPQDLVTAGMGLVAATAADLLRKSYGGMGADKWPLRTTSKVGLLPLEKSPYKVDLEKSGLKVKKISYVGDPNRYNIHESKHPSKSATEAKPPNPGEMQEKPVLETMKEVLEETPSATDSKTVKKVLKPEEAKKPAMEEAKEEEEKKKGSSPAAAKMEETTVNSAEKVTEESVKLVGEGSKDGLDPSSILRIEGCGPDARRDSSGKCVLKEQQPSLQQQTELHLVGRRTEIAAQERSPPKYRIQ